MAEFLVALADFDRRRGWEALGHASLFAFLVVELGLSTSSTYWRVSAARLLQTFPEVAGPLRQGGLCLTSMAELAKVLTVENREAVLPRFLGLSSREAKEVVAELQPREAPPLRAVVTSLASAGDRAAPAAGASNVPAAGPLPPVATRSPEQDPSNTYSGSLRAPETQMTHPARDAAPRAEVEPLTAELRRLHITVSRQLLKKLEAARHGLSHAIPSATMEQVLEAALDLLLEKQARARGQVKRPRSVVPAGATAATTATASAETPTRSTPWKPTQLEDAPETVGAAAATPCAAQVEPDERAGPVHRRDGPRQAIPAAVRRAVWERDGGRCSWPLDGDCCCGSTHLLELDHIHPWARDGEPTVANVRVVCRAHDALAARREFGARCAERYRASRRA